MEITKVIKAHGWQNQAVAKALGISAVSFAQSISGNPTVKRLKEIAVIIGADMAEFFADERPVSCVEVSGSVRCPFCGKPFDLYAKKDY